MLHRCRYAGGHALALGALAGLEEINAYPGARSRWLVAPQQQVYVNSLHLGHFACLCGSRLHVEYAIERKRGAVLCALQIARARPYV